MPSNRLPESALPAKSPPLAHQLLAATLVLGSLLGCALPGPLFVAPVAEPARDRVAQSAQRTLRPEPFANGPDTAVVEGRGASSAQLLLSGLRDLQPHPFDRLAAPGLGRSGRCLPPAPARRTPLRQARHAGLPEAGRVAHPAQGPPIPC